MCTESYLNSTGSIEDKKSINESLSTEVELNVEDVCKNETDCTELNETTSNTEDSLDSFELVDYPDPSEIQIAGFNKEKLAQMCTFSKMTYGNNDTKLFQAGYKTIGSFISEDYSVIPFYYCSGRQAGFVFTKDREITIAYRGTQDFADIITDLLAMLVPLEFLPEGGRVHYGFYYSFCDSQDSLLRVLEHYAKEQKLEIKDFKFYLTGHSMGGAIAKIAASTLATAGVSLGIAISIYLEMLAVGITVGVCLVLSAAAVFSYYHNSQAISPKSSLETVSNTPYLKSDNICQTSL